MSSRRVILLLSLAAFMVMTDNWVASPLLPAISGSIGVPTVSAGILIAAYMLPFGIFQLVFGPLADRVGKMRVILGTFAVFAVATTLCAVGSTLTSAALLRALTGIFAAATMPVSFALIANLVPMENRQSAIGSFMGIGFLGQAFSMGIGGAIAQVFDWRGVFIVYGVVSIGVAVALWRGLRSAVGDHEKRSPHALMFKPYVGLLRTPASFRTYAVILVEGVFLLGSFSYLRAILAERFGLSYLAIGAVMTAFGIAAIVAGRTSARIAVRIGRTRTVALGLLIAAAAEALVWAGGSSLILTTLGLFALGYGFMTAHSSLITIATEFAAQARGAGMSLALFSLMLGGAAGTQLAGMAIAATPFTAMYAFRGIGLLVLAALALAALRAAGSREIAPATQSA